MTALEQIFGFWFLLVAAWWAGPMFPHDEDGVTVPLRRLSERQCWAYRSDPGLVLANPSQEGETSLPPALAANAGEAEVVIGTRPASPALQGHHR